jgi:small GTP-binding protein
MPVGRYMKVKVCLVGKESVGKTSLVRRYVLDQFDDRYIVTLGAKVSKKVLNLEAPDGSGNVEVDITIWDIMGSKAFRELLREAYFHGAQGILAVADLTREDSFKEVETWVDNVFSTVGPIPVVLALNKVDLQEQRVVKDEDIRAGAEKLQAPFFCTSAKTGENVEAAFKALAERVMEREYKLAVGEAAH